MNSGLHSQFVSDALTQRQHYVERAKTGLHDDHDAVSLAVIAALLLALSKLSYSRVGQLNRRQLSTLVLSVRKVYNATSKRYTDDLTEWLRRYSDLEAQHLREVMNHALEEADEDASDVWPLVAAGLIGATGGTIADTLRGLRSNQRGRVESTIKRAYSQNWSFTQLVTAFRGTTARRFKDGLMPKLKRAAAATVDTVVQYGMSAARLQMMQKYMDWTLGYTWMSILDSRTSATCRSLSGRVFKYGAGPVPPVHYRCRSHIEPIFKRTAKLAVTDKAVTAGETYYNWLKRQPSKFQDETMGKTLGRLFRKGGLSTNEFAAKVVNARYEPLTLEQLRKQSPDLFRRAGV